MGKTQLQNQYCRRWKWWKMKECLFLKICI